MSLTDAAPLITALGGVGGIAAAVRWWADRAERIRKEDLARDEAKRVADLAAAKELGAALTASAAAQDRLADAVGALVPRVVRIEERLDRVDLTGEHRRAAVPS